MKTNPSYDTVKVSLSQVPLIDSHCHLDMPAYSEDIVSVLKNARSHGVKRIISVGVNLASSRDCIDLAIKYPEVSATIGVHPHDVGSMTDSDYEDLAKLYLASKHVIVGFGEIGLDYYRNHSTPAAQRIHFKKQLELAKKLKLPVIIHNRQADDDILNTLRELHPFPNRGILHCFSGEYNYAKKILDLGFYISIPGIVTFKNSTILQEVVRKIPLTAMIVETDGPYLAPIPFRGKRNEPAFLQYTVKKIAELRGSDYTEIARQTTENAMTLFSIKTI